MNMYFVLILSESPPFTSNVCVWHYEHSLQYDQGWTIGIYLSDLLIRQFQHEYYWRIDSI